jgi:hypothetical protein
LRARLEPTVKQSLFPLIKPYLQFSHIRLSDHLHLRVRRMLLHVYVTPKKFDLRLL